MTTPRRPTLDELAAAPLDDADAGVLDRIAALYTTLDPVPDTLVDRIQFGITLDALHAEIAELQRSSELVGVRGDEVTEAQTITFTSSTLSMMVTITPLSAVAVRLDGWIAPGGPIEIELRLRSGSRHTTADEDGRFSFDDVPRELAQFVVRPSDANSPSSTVVTPSLEL